MKNNNHNLTKKQRAKALTPPKGEYDDLPGGYVVTKEQTEWIVNSSISTALSKALSNCAICGNQFPSIKSCLKDIHCEKCKSSYKALEAAAKKRNEALFKLYANKLSDIKSTCSDKFKKILNI